VTKVQASAGCGVAAATVGASSSSRWSLPSGFRPDGPTLRLLEVAEQHPEVLLVKVLPRRRGRRSPPKAE